MEIFRSKLPASILIDHNYLFHGTSNIYESKLDTGDTKGNKEIPIELISNVLSLYKGIKWFGDHGGGYAVLSTFSVADQNRKGKYLFLGETYQRSCLYATKDFAGGELNRSLYHSIRDLFTYIEDKAVREKHRKQMERDYPFTGEKYDVNLEYLNYELKKYLQIYSELSNLINSYKYGVIYCYKIEKEDYPKLIHRGQMGIMVHEPLPSKRLQAKLILNNPEEIYNENLISNSNFKRSLIWKSRLSG
ncbi:hypothetical protein [Maribellus mangrovi]|uniref:hypothetical protein n=1 Tax=Maribellus mangrovi TaxID=3133146 RepID=UPI0030EB44C6